MGCGCSVVDEERMSAVSPLIAVLEELAGVIESLTDEQYARKPVGVIASSVGGHVRHCLDHVRALVRAVERGFIDYDRRERGTDVEKDRAAAAAEVWDLVTRLAEVGEASVGRAVTVSVMMDASAPSVRVRSSFGRELAFVLSHTIHHNSIVAAMVKTLGGELPERFGYAPATVASWRQSACAR